MGYRKQIYRVTSGNCEIANVEANTPYQAANHALSGWLDLCAQEQRIPALGAKITVRGRDWADTTESVSYRTRDLVARAEKMARKK